jgi:hypothetical protein
LKEMDGLAGFEHGDSVTSKSITVFLDVFFTVRNIKPIRVCQEGIQADTGTEVNGPATILNLREKFGIGTEGASTERDESRALGFSISFFLLGFSGHRQSHCRQATWVGRSRPSYGAVREK